jgi:hypothetical protein
LLEELKLVYWRVLDSLNMIPVSAGQVIYNATPARLLAGPDARQSAEVHALGNPEGREILALEVRRPGPTFRAWDNVRFPVRDIDIDAALDALNLTATTAEDFIVAPELIPGRVGVLCSVDSPSFRIEHLRPGGEPEQGVTVPAEPPHCLHVVRGTVELRSESGEDIGTLSRGESALVPVGVGAYVASAREEGVEIQSVRMSGAHGRLSEHDQCRWRGHAHGGCACSCHGPRIPLWRFDLRGFQNIWRRAAALR